MANLKNDLDEYLLLQSDQKKTFKIDMKMPSMPEMKNLFGKSEPQEANSWLKDTQESCCPKLVYIISVNLISVLLRSLLTESTTTHYWIRHMYRAWNLLHDRVSYNSYAINNKINYSPKHCYLTKKKPF